EHRRWCFYARCYLSHPGFIYGQPLLLRFDPLCAPRSQRRERGIEEALPSFASRAASLSFHDEVVGVETLDL
ncbi:unnamed protein product, partial [Musa banksii]